MEEAEVKDYGKLDKALMNCEWSNKFTDTSVNHLVPDSENLTYALLDRSKESIMLSNQGVVYNMNDEQLAFTSKRVIILKNQELLVMVQLLAALTAGSSPYGPHITNTPNKW
ncbi:hypothetical protein RND71_032134 [Anisodus tanguticus]|uniref:Uncharacterized protein n=1 Tax=Anisodus tanguticus TaxID=243964 RepID=A0AAE1RC23_9SOLA|nr:hypothetical protein RND71_032134 [Anisodus tanguticus]